MNTSILVTSRPSLAKSIVMLSKPGIIRANILTLVTGYFFASGDTNFTKLTALIVGTALIISASCILNNVFDTHIDQKMTRTKKRKEALEVVGQRLAVILSTIFMFFGVVVLILAKLYIAVIAGVVAFITYVFLYTPLKKKTPFALQIGTVPGALSLIAGYLSKEDFSVGTAVLLFVIMFCWQMVHFLGIALYRKDDYKKANVPTYPNVLGTTRTWWEIKFYAVCFLITTSFLSWENLNYSLGVVILAVTSLWIFYIFRSMHLVKEDKQVGKKIFISSLPILLIFCLALCLQGVID